MPGTVVALMLMAPAMLEPSEMLSPNGRAWQCKVPNRSALRVSAPKAPDSRMPERVGSLISALRSVLNELLEQPESAVTVIARQPGPPVLRKASMVVVRGRGC